MLAAGTKLGRYEIRLKIGEGGIGEVISRLIRASLAARSRSSCLKVNPIWDPLRSDPRFKPLENPTLSAR